MSKMISCDRCGDYGDIDKREWWYTLDVSGVNPPIYTGLDWHKGSCYQIDLCQRCYSKFTSQFMGYGYGGYEDEVNN